MELLIHDTDGHVLHAIVLGSNDDVVDVDEMLWIYDSYFGVNEKRFSLGIPMGMCFMP